MIKPGQLVEVNWNPNNRAYYESLGYTFTKFKQSFLVKVEDLSKSAKIDIVEICDNCGKEYKISMCNHTRSMKNSGNVVCKECRIQKIQNTLFEKYGVISPSQIDGVSEKIKQTCIEKYGVDNPAKFSSIQEKTKNTMIQKYGKPYAPQNDLIKEKIKNTCLEKYGVSNVLNSTEFRAKIEQTMIERYGAVNPGLIEEFVAKAKLTCQEKYGGESSQCSEIIRKKSWETMLENGSTPSSKKERELVKILEEMYGVENCVPSFVESKMLFDCLLNIKDVKIDVEYDGWYWHKNKQEQDKRRDYYTIKHGYKVLRILSNGSIPQKEQIQEGVDYLVNSEHRVYKIVLDDIDI